MQCIVCRKDGLAGKKEKDTSTCIRHDQSVRANGEQEKGAERKLSRKSFDCYVIFCCSLLLHREDTPLYGLYNFYIGMCKP